MTEETEQIINHPVFGRLEVVDDSDPSLLTVRNKNGNTFRMGKAAAGWEVPAYVRGIPTPAPSVPAAPPPRGFRKITPVAKPAGALRVPTTSARIPAARPAATVNGTNQTMWRKTMDAKVIEFLVERETKNTVRYEEQTDGQPPSVGTLYVQKWALGNPVPQKLKVTIEAGD